MAWISFGFRDFFDRWKEIILEKQNIFGMEFFTQMKFKILFQDDDNGGKIFLSKLSDGYYAETRLTLKIEHLHTFINNVSNIFEENTVKISLFI